MDINNAYLMDETDQKMCTKRKAGLVTHTHGIGNLSGFLSHNFLKKLELLGKTCFIL